MVDMVNWREYYQKRTISAEEAAKMVKSNDYIIFTTGREATTVGKAIAARKSELKGIKMLIPSPINDFGWYAPEWADIFEIIVGMPTGISQQMIDDRRCDLIPSGHIPLLELPYGPPDILLTEVSAPNAQGFCSFGNSVWNKKNQIREAKLVIAEINDKLVWPHGETTIHCSEIDYFVLHAQTGREPGKGTLAGRAVRQEIPEYVKTITANVNSLLRDRDCIQIGIGRTTEPMVRLGMLQGKNDIGYHSEATPPGIVTAVKDGIITGKYKNINTDKCVCTSLGGGTKEEMEWADNNPSFHLVNLEYLEDVRVISAHDNMVAINNCLAVDLRGQITAESLGPKLFSGAGGQIPFVMAAFLSKGGRAITVMPSTAQDGKVSRIVPFFPEGTVVTIQMHLAHYIVTEYGIADLRAKTARQRAEALINIAHPDFRDELRKQAKKLLWP